MSSDASRTNAAPPAKRFPLGAWIGSACPLAMVWVALLVTHAVSTGVLISLAIAIVVLVLWIGIAATVRIRRGR
ncbi:hypothetical protein [Streptomyces morookaense]|uniref:Uncharacterized protein n=1 Tax=Streptomyces morookaense TaxID=1970 RepID=A0A7Y7B534_STRMO|nr:hypothetical protein [Streptomyces morookaense]NVK79174.1 hypothetical protein [Streptomyces morookaense]GHF27990.1 hypothetical protein GCM10010359_33000 [Streptomyces morookaense]